MNVFNKAKALVGKALGWTKDRLPETKDDEGYQPSREERVYAFARCFPDTSAEYGADAARMKRRQDNAAERTSWKIKGTKPLRRNGRAIMQDGTVYRTLRTGWRKMGRVSL